MGFYRTDYIVYGWKLPFEIKDNNGNKIDLWNDKFLPYIEGHPNVNYLLMRDNIAGRYTVFGLKLYKQKDDDGWDFQKLEFNSHPLSTFNNGSYSLNSLKLKDKFKELFGFDIDIEPELFIFTNYA